MIFKKRLNNNVVIALDENGQEKILCGKGLGFQMKEQGTVEESRVEKVFALADQVMNRRLQELLETIPMEHLELAEEIMNYARIHIDETVSENVIVALCDHMYMAVERKKQGIEVKNVLLWDIQKFYRDEYKVGRYAIALIRERFNVELSEDEAGFIALHIVNGQLHLETKSVREITTLMQQIETIVRMRFAITLDPDSVHHTFEIFCGTDFLGKADSNKGNGRTAGADQGKISAGCGMCVGYRCLLKAALWLYAE